ncbi:hypothetical protein [Paenibacillus kobensis]|uniref:hypothetical protein n=1 Tax=Paenibacillus kobensis TaxID=59841 RepID=UPI000FD87406|nr:hypothetical protein [Paenibacillus kobensis]
MEFKRVSIYVDKTNNLIVIANGLIDKWGGMIKEIDMVEQLSFPYEENNVETILLQMMNNWCALTPEEVGSTPLEKCLGLQGYTKAVKGRKFIDFSWRINEGYFVTPTRREKTGFVSLKDKRIMLGQQIVPGTLYCALMNAIDQSTSL